MAPIVSNRGWRRDPRSRTSLASDIQAIEASHRTPRRLSASVLGRHVPASDDRDGAFLRPGLLIADGPTTALDVTIQARILELVTEPRASREMAIIWITHELGVVADLADWVAVMYGGYIVEYARAGSLFASPRHPYTTGLTVATYDFLSVRGMGRSSWWWIATATYTGASPAPGGCRNTSG